MAPPESPLTMDPCVAHVCQTNHMWGALPVPGIINFDNSVRITSKF